MLLAAVTDGLGQPALQFATSSYTVPEWAGTVMLTVQRLNDTNSAVTVDYATADGTATNGFKYTATNGTLEFAAGETDKPIVVPILNEGFVEGAKNFRVILSNPTGGAVLGARATATVSITDTDVGIQFEFANYNAASGWSWAEDAGAVLIGVARGDDANLAATVVFGTSDVTATNGVDYIGFTNTLSFAPTERLKFVPVTILNDSLKEPANKTFRATLSSPVGVSLGTTKTTTVTIMDNDQGFAFEAAKYDVAEDAGVALIGVLRGTDETNSTVTVDLTSGESSALNGQDYIGLTNTLTFRPGEQRKVVAVPILNDGVKEGLENFTLTLSNPTGGAVLGAPTTTTVSIRDNDPGLGFEATTYTTAWGQAADFAVTVLRGNDGALGPIGVDYATSDGTAKAGEDYQAVSGKLEFQANETVKSLPIPIFRSRAGKNFRVTLSNPTAGVTLGTASTMVNVAGKYATVAPAFDTGLTIRRESGLNVLTWAGGGQLQRADKPTGPWQTLANATSPFTVNSPVPTTFYRATRPRPVSLYVPSSYTGQTNIPLVIVLHGYGATGQQYEGPMQLQGLAEERGFLYCLPDGTKDSCGLPFWNAVDSCCDFRHSGVDDAGYLQGLTEEAARKFAVDRKRIHLFGHSNGGCMAYRMACQHADLIASIATLAGQSFTDPALCVPSQPVNILHVHGTDDEYVPYGPGCPKSVGCSPTARPPWPGVTQNLQTWADYNGATLLLTEPAPSLDLTTDVGGLDTTVSRYMTCPPGGAVELWTINRGGHMPTLSSQFSPLVIDWLLAHPKP